MRKLAALIAFSLIAGSSATALADRAPRRPDPEETKTDDAKKEDGEAKKDDGEAKKDGDAKKAEEKSGNCSVTEEDDAMLGFAVLMLLGSGLALRRRTG